MLRYHGSWYFNEGKSPTAFFFALRDCTNNPTNPCLTPQLTSFIEYSMNSGGPHHLYVEVFYPPVSCAVANSSPMPPAFSRVSVISSCPLFCLARIFVSCLCSCCDFWSNFHEFGLSTTSAVSACTCIESVKRFALAVRVCAAPAVDFRGHDFFFMSR